MEELQQRIINILGFEPVFGTYHPQDLAQVQAILTAVAESEAEAFIKWGWGERCKTKDIDDFPENKDDPLASRCANCEMWEHYDEFKAQLGKEEL